MHPEEPRGVGSALSAGEDHLPDFVRLVRLQLRPASSEVTLGARGGEPRARALANHRPLELRKASQDLHDHAAGGARRVDGLGEAAKAGARRLDLVQDEDQIAQRARETIEFPHDDDVALAELLEHAVQLAGK